MRRLIKTVSLRSGIDVCYAERGDPAGAPLVLLPGYTDSLASFGPLVDALPPWIRTLSLSLRGHGRSSKPDSSYDTAELAGDVAGFFGALALDRAVVLGHSMGSVVARRFAAQYPERTRGLILIGSFLSTKDHPGVEELWRDVAGLRDPIDPAFVRAFQESTLAEPVAPSFLDMVVRESLEVPAHVWRSALAAMRREDHAEGLDAIRAPAVVVWGDQDAFSDRAAQGELTSRIRGSRLDVLRGCGHAPHWERPREIANLVAAFEPLVEASASRARETTLSNTDPS